MKSTLVLALFCSALLAEQSHLQPLEIHSTGIDQNELKAADAVEIFTSEQIESANPKDLYEFLTQYSSLVTLPAYGNAFSQKIDMRGYGIGDGYQNIVISVNGRRMNNVDMTAQLLASISPEMIERIEIIKSGGIVTRGDGANAGVINITTKRNYENRFNLYGGIYHTAEGSLYLGHTDELLAASAFIEGYTSDGTRTIDNTGNSDTQKLANGRLEFSLTPNEALELHLAGQFNQSDLHYGGPMSEAEYEEDPSQAGSGYGYGPSPAHQKYRSNLLSSGLRYDISPEYTFDAAYHLEKKRSEYVTYASISDYTYHSFNAALTHKGSAYELVLGLDGFDGERDSRGSKTSKENLSLYLMSQWYFGNATLKAGYRAEKVSYTQRSAIDSLDDDHTLHGAELGYNYRFDVKQSLFVNYARSYQAPDIDRFFNQDYMSGGVVFNGFIDPMTANNYNLGYSRFDTHNKFKIALYYIDLENEIYYYSDPRYIASANTNIDASYKYGLDIYEHYVFNPELALTFNYNYVQAIIDEEMQNGEDYSGNKLPGVSNHTLKVALHLTPNEQTSITLMHTHRSKAYAMNDFGNSFAQKQDAYNSTDLNINYDYAQMTLFAKITNLFNESNALWVQDDAIYPVNFTTTAIAGVKVRF